MSESPISAWRERNRVKIGFVFAILFIWRAQPRIYLLLVVGIALAFLGILLRQWAAGYLRKNDELATTGPYSLVRNPLYLGSLIAAFGLILATSSFHLSLSRPYLDRTLFFWCFLWILIDSVYIPKIAKEEQHLKDKFGDEFEKYSHKVPSLLPKTLKHFKPDLQGFHRSHWLKNEEYWSLLGYLVVCAILLGRYFNR